MSLTHPALVGALMTEGSNEMTYAIVRDGIIVNIIAWDGAAPYVTPEGCELHAVEGAAGVGWLYDGVTFTNPTPPPPEPVAPPVPTKEELLAQLAALQAQIVAMKE